MACIQFTDRQLLIALCHTCAPLPMPCIQFDPGAWHSIPYCVHSPVCNSPGLFNCTHCLMPRAFIQFAIGNCVHLLHAIQFDPIQSRAPIPSIIQLRAFNSPLCAFTYRLFRPCIGSPARLIIPLTIWRWGTHYHHPDDNRLAISRLVGLAS